ncbi:MAG: phospho-N-acetylmuramoyl-pentapeptide-transferase [Candidatus Eisenbacteria bacterium]|nr:phospho-N-acetylmuramoyl-pentapeptide-transferase [Candidatus Eisenbacteria bacterium]
MLYHLLFPMRDAVGVFNVFQYITFRSAYAAITALIVAFLLGPVIIRWLRARGWGQLVRDEGPASHHTKRGTPTMGGLMILLAILAPTLLWANLSNVYIQIILLVTLFLGGLGFLDDYLRVVRQLPKGLLGRYKLTGQIAVGLLVGGLLLWIRPQGELTTQTTVPFFKDALLNIGVLYLPLAVLVITASSNAVNLSDGLDGLAIGMIIPPAVAFGGLAYVSGHSRFAEYLNIPYMPGVGELTIYCSAFVGAALGFLWFNAHPAEVFMGDTGSLALGGCLGTLAILIKRELLLVVVGGLFVVEALSVMLQVVSWKTRRRRIFRMAPLHHHFELEGWPETRIVVRFWIISILLALITLSTVKLQ